MSLSHYHAEGYLIGDKVMAKTELANTWNNCIVTVDSGVVVGFFNGLKSTETLTGYGPIWSASPYATTLGGGTSGVYWYSGLLRDVFLTSSVINQSQATSIANREKGYV